MIGFKKEYSLKLCAMAIIAVSLKSSSYLCNSRDSLRIPIGNLKHIAEAMSDKSRVDDIRASFVRILERASFEKEKVLEMYCQACIEHVEELYTLLNIEAGVSAAEDQNYAIQELPFTLLSAIQYAYIKHELKITKEVSNKELKWPSLEPLFERFVQLDTPEKWWDEIERILRDEKMKSYVLDNMWRRLSAVIPGRAKPLQLILQAYFGEKAILGLDVGCGLVNAFPLLSLDYFLDAPDFKTSKGQSVARPLWIVFGAGLDKQPNDLLWSLTSMWPIPKNQGRRKLVCAVYKEYQKDIKTIETKAVKGGKADIYIQYPFYQADFLQSKTYIKKLRKNIAEARSKNRTGIKGSELDFVFTSFFLYQINPSKLESVKSMISNLLIEGGLWIDVGYERFLKLRNIERYGVRVWRKTKGKLEYLGIPVYLHKNQENIAEINSLWFAKWTNAAQQDMWDAFMRQWTERSKIPRGDIEIREIRDILFKDTLLRRQP